MLIGGGAIGKGNHSYETGFIDMEIVKMSELEHPNLLFIGFASNYAESYYEVIKKNFRALGCETSFLKKKNCIHNLSFAYEKIKNADIIYIGGGDTIQLMEMLREYSISSCLKEAMDRGCLLVGISAGAIALCMEGFSDSYILRGESSHYAFVEGLGFAPISICPHYHSSSTQMLELKESIGKRMVFGLENGTALKVIDGNVVPFCSDDGQIYSCYFEDGFVEKAL